MNTKDRDQIIRELLSTIENLRAKVKELEETKKSKGRSYVPGKGTNNVPGICEKAPF